MIIFPEIATLIVGFGVAYFTFQWGYYILEKKYIFYKLLSSILLFLSIFLFIVTLMQTLNIYLNFNLNSLITMFYSIIVSFISTKNLFEKDKIKFKVTYYKDVDLY